MISLGDRIQKQVESDEGYSFFSYFEPWDVKERSPEIVELARKDGVDLYNDDLIRTGNVGAHQFQSGYLLDDMRFRGVIGPTQGGKALTLDSDVYTTNGMKKMRDMIVGDRVVTPNGTANVIGVHPQGIRPVYEFTFNDGTSVKCDEEHLWTVLPRDGSTPIRTKRGKRIANVKFNKWETITAKEIISKAGVGAVPGHFRYSIPRADHVEFESRPLLLGPYTMGAILGDGGITHRALFTCHPDDIAITERMSVESSIEMRKHADKFGFAMIGVSEKLRQYGLMNTSSKTKFIPEDFKFNSYENRLELLRGLMDTDGSVTLRGLRSSPKTEISVSSKKLADDIVWLVQSLGGWCHVSSRTPWYYSDARERIMCSTSYRLKVTMFVNPFRLQRKADRWRPNTERYMQRVLRKIEFCGYEKTQCIRIDNDEKLFLTNGFVATHNSIQALIEIGCICSGEFPISMQYDKGVDTGVKRIISGQNIRRWGRRSVKTKRLIDYNADAEKDGTWDCGTIIGAGKFPKEKCVPGDLTNEKEERVIWIGTTQRALTEAWWPKLVEEGQRIFPKKFIDASKGNAGVNRVDNIIHLINDIRLSMITYEQGHHKFESITTWACYFDEEPKDQRCVSAAIGHCKYFSLIMTPLHGITYTRDIFFRKPSPNKRTYHATAYDSPYLTRETIDENRSQYPDYEIGARFWALHTAAAQRPYYNRRKLQMWLSKMAGFKNGYRAEINPDRPYFGVIKKPHISALPGLMDIGTVLVPIDDSAPVKDCEWMVYEDLQKDGAYLIIADNANGADLPEDAGDFGSALVLRAPKPERGEARPVLVAEMSSKSTPEIFASHVGLSLNYYNFATLAGEAASRGAANGMFFSELRDYPFWYTRTVKKQASRKDVTQKGFDMNSGTRKPIFDEIEAWFSDFDEDDDPMIPSETILTMASECLKVIKNGNMRPDHPAGKNNDMLVCFGMGIYIFKIFPEQMKCRRSARKENVDSGSKMFVKRMLEAANISKQRKASGFPMCVGRSK